MKKTRNKLNYLNQNSFTFQTKINFSNEALSPLVQNIIKPSPKD